MHTPRDNGFGEFVVYCRHSPEFMREYDRLRGSTFTRRGMPALVDITSGKREKDEAELMAFLVELYRRLGFERGRA